MTDLQRHLKVIRKALRNAPPTDYAAALRNALPSSYGVTAQPLTLYDVPLHGDVPPPLEKRLLLAHAAPTSEALADALAQVAAVKAKLPPNLPTASPPRAPLAQHKLRIPKTRLPYALLHYAAFHQTHAALFAMLRAYPPHLRPDELTAPGIEYRNPLLDGIPPTGYDGGLSLTPPWRKPMHCYTCREKFFRRHWFYEQLCVPCGDLNVIKRTESADLTGKIALVTGARVNIGYAVTLRLLRAGATVVGTTRFVANAARRYATEPDFATWCDRLHLYRLDLRHPTALSAFIDTLRDDLPHLDVLVNNAAQTVKRPATYYAPLIAEERAALPAPARLLLRSDDLPAEAIEPNGFADPIDNRAVHSWVLRLDEVPLAEIAEVHMVNAVAPAALAGGLRASMRPGSYIINVAAAEGQFAQTKKGTHPHTNMAKAALNMLTRSIADDYSRDGVTVISVDPGWVSDQQPRTHDAARAVAIAKVPLDLVDAAARVCDPVVTGSQVRGVLLKDYRTAAW